MNKIYAKYGDGAEFVGTYIEEVAGLKIYFGHQSVGNNIISGITRWEDETGVQLAKVESKDPASNTGAPFVHFRVGSNSDPHSKIDDFVSLVAQIPDEENPVAFFKFCYVDIRQDTDVDLVYDYYREKMLYLVDTYPNIRFAACTVPIMGLEKGIKATAKKMLGRQSDERPGNMKREEFNKKLLNDFQGVVPVFDLGGIESTLPDGSRVTYKFKESDYPYMPDIYTYDLGHLTELGSKTLAYNLLAFLAVEFK